MTRQWNPATGQYEDVPSTDYERAVAQPPAADVRPDDMVTGTVPPSFGDGGVGPMGIPLTPGPRPPLPATALPPLPGVPVPSSIPPVSAQPRPAPALDAPIAPKGGGASVGGGAAPKRGGVTPESDLDRNTRDSIANQKRAGEQDVARAGLAEDQANSDLVARQEFSDRAEIERKQQDTEIAKQKARLAAETEKRAAMKPTDYFEAMPAWRKVLAALSVGLGAMGQAFDKRGGGRNGALDIINSAIDDHSKLQASKALNQDKIVDSARGDVASAREAKAEALLSIGNERKDYFEKAAMEAKAKLAALGKTDAEINSNGLVIGLQQKAMETKQELDQATARLANIKSSTALNYAQAARQRAEARGGGPGAEKPLTESQGKAADLASRMIHEQKTIEKLGAISPEGLKRLRELAKWEDAAEKNPRTRAVLVAQGLLKTPEEVLNNDKDRMIYSAQFRFTNSALRGDSGGAVTIPEFMSFGQAYFAQPGDKAADAAAKREAGQRVIDGALMKAGRGADMVRAQAASGPQPAASPVVQRKTKDGRMVNVRQHPDGRWEVVN